MHAVLASLVAAALALGPFMPHAATTVEVVQGQVLRLESVQDVDAMRSMVVGVPVAWDVGVSASEPDGTIAIALQVAATDGAFRGDVRACPVAWSADGCAAQEMLFSGPLQDGTLALGTQAASQTRWYRVQVELVAESPGARSDLVVVASGSGETVASDGATLPRTGSAPHGWLVAAALLACAAGAAAIARPSRRRSP
ncbi:hypothetical protein [Agrococcus sp. SGAir0287]|uniref:hypothetical protein n=1 Tax=Agrococcus sp. SGAir0287 TaxID=2070347 RepID=UPI0010CCC027|nr:hypothetical protein [Agrococcus sp. SGAir0287]QCR19777.1 hypothetical protein C1N71_10350 [Agrococcus sp. SGAir0287]